MPTARSVDNKARLISDFTCSSALRNIRRQYCMSAINNNTKQMLHNQIGVIHIDFRRIQLN
ncbi:hypothetical protein T4B_4002 [Trichinella pseudospiralis]|uniref:Uncharacterized protein n=2 Tax=Trichinella pseudospiralis TaxID=6337 RepID=A0A0V1JXV1_TRIPS|nr:hypothetical protein T4A_13151 [Trichinella pseudospiralis]KRY87483.1 hypothetical protein T4D_14376 [Trichinella pseudospiralis]KRZ22163.1 hypothetical protein T4B_4002 [Trichinella pseudospiralis]KRZ39803.1 hypothetical protein T4C_2792 [Trichinella pseudospiralis]